MSHFLDRLTYFRRTREKFSDGHGITTDEAREWEDAYRKRWAADKIVRVVKALGLSRFDLKYSNGTLPHERLMSSIELYGTQVVPRVREMLGR